MWVKAGETRPACTPYSAHRFAHVVGYDVVDGQCRSTGDLLSRFVAIRLECPRCGRQVVRHMSDHDTVKRLTQHPELRDRAAPVRQMQVGDLTAGTRLPARFYGMMHAAFDERRAEPRHQPDARPWLPRYSSSRAFR
ncbi:MAG TPA: hypothetical protein VH328_14175 [Burkholderiaceae bacterium]|jgi:predicted RNA-binding Zn-ribbon protein involved in translation (DUF1610 family)|nr:hypothetical protein [Burkholderiaceae bacterium]